MSDTVVVPREPTRPMLRAMLKALEIDPGKRCEDVLDHLELHKAGQTLAAYRAMIEAAEEDATAQP